LCKVVVSFHCDLGLTNVLPPSSLPPSLPSLPQALALLPKARNHYNLAVSFQSQGDNRAAISSYRMALAMDETGIPDAYFNLGVALQEEGELEVSSSFVPSLPLSISSSLPFVITTVFAPASLSK